jgi:uncharacterized protein (DUF1015 family)
VTRIRPFRAVRYDPDRVDLGRVIAPPYDVIAARDRADLFERDPHNAVRLELTRDVADEAGTDYAEVPATFRSWQRDAVLVRDDRPAIYGLRQQFEAPDGSRCARDGFFALLQLEDYARRVVRPHELTLAGPKADRLKLLRAARANLSSVFVLYEDLEGKLTRSLHPVLDGEPLAVAREPGGTHTLTRIDDTAALDTVAGFLADRPVVIADGHHRYETALEFRKEQGGGANGEAACDWILAYFANAYAPGNLLLPIHRLIVEAPAPSSATWRDRLPGWRLETVAVEAAEAIPSLLEEHLSPRAGEHAFAADDGSGQHRVFSRPRGGSGNGTAELGVRVIHREVIEGVFGLDEEAVRHGAIDYPKSALQVARDLRAGRGSVALYLNPLSPDDVFRVTEAGEVLPQKSTFFYPKLPTGLVFRPLEAP